MLTDSQEHFWGTVLSKDEPTYTWSFEEEDEDSDYMIHTLFLKAAVLATSAVKGERNVIQVETANFEKKPLKQPILSLTLGQMDMCNIDLSFGHETPVTFRLVEGCGPVTLCGQQLVEFPPEEMGQDESVLDESVESERTDEESPKKSRKRKATKGDKKKGKMDKSLSSEGDDSMEDEEDEDEEDDDEEEEDMEEEESADDKKKKSNADIKGKGRSRARSRSRSKGRTLKVTLKRDGKRSIVKAKRKVKDSV